MKIATSNQDLLKNINSLPGVSVVIEEAALSYALPDCRIAPEQIISVLSFLHRKRGDGEEALKRLAATGSNRVAAVRETIASITLVMDSIRDGLNAWGQSQADGVTFFGVYWVDDAGKHLLCEVDGGTCYEAYRDFDKALQSAGYGNRVCKTDRYIVKAIPAGVKVFDTETECAIITTESTGISVICGAPLLHEDLKISKSALKALKDAEMIIAANARISINLLTYFNSADRKVWRNADNLACLIIDSVSNAMQETSLTFAANGFRDLSHAIDSYICSNLDTWKGKSDRYGYQETNTKAELMRLYEETHNNASYEAALNIKNATMPNVSDVEFYRLSSTGCVFVVAGRSAYWFDSVNGRYLPAGECINVGDMRRNVSGTWSKL